MKSQSLLSVILLWSGVYAIPQQPGGQINSPEALASPGTGPHGAHFFTDESLPQHVIYQPKNIPKGLKAPLLVWGNGGCLNVGTIMAPFLIQLASQGMVVIANGSPEDPAKGGTFASYGTYGKSSAKSLTASIDWAVKNSALAKWAHIDTTRVAAAGQSCGGFEASQIASDSRISTFGIFNSGLPNTKFTKPVFYFLGGKGDMAASGGKSSYSSLPANTPAWMGNWAPKGHGGTFNEINGGIYGAAASHWVNWMLRGNVSSASFFTGGGAKSAGWSDISSKNLDKIKLPPPI